ncbi:mitochondrial import protein Pam17 [Leucosporidium creatinivorum]|uniref:Presequence translocated-associated motor subunit PAM17 n=1 Tax=Leucosporidium creatinivorum TaxID=106004 RepID=A0A1Y2F8I7_9BASI|nr:mitochondrial import protein Pam17 [Leucosporidium creatinivorum]
MSFRTVSLISRLPTTTPAIRRPFSSSAFRRAAAPAPRPVETQTLDWPTFLRMRRQQRIIGLAASVPTTIVGLGVGVQYFASIEADAGSLIMGVEAVYVLGAAAIGCGVVGWLVGPVVGNQIWRLTHRKALKAFETKEKDFFEHIKRNRADPSRQSVSNPVPDYYAEHVSSLRLYRVWLRDQAAHSRKAAFGDGADRVL